VQEAGGGGQDGDDQAQRDQAVNRGGEQLPAEALNQWRD
jgi:hypothetical protein